MRDDDNIVPFLPVPQLPAPSREELRRAVLAHVKEAVEQAQMPGDKVRFVADPVIREDGRFMSVGLIPARVIPDPSLPPDEVRVFGANGSYVRIVNIGDADA